MAVNDAHSVAIEWLKQVITLSSGIIVLSGTFLSSVFKQLNWSIWLLMGSWLFLLGSIILSLETISVITQSRIQGNQDWSKRPGRIYAGLAKLFFILGIGIFIFFALVNFISTYKSNQNVVCRHCERTCESRPMHNSCTSGKTTVQKQ
jgi:hypothetical protein